MSKWISLVVVASVTFFLSGFLESGAYQKKAAPPQKPKTSPTLGTVQLPGDNGKLAVTYQLGAKGSELHFTLDSAKVATHFATPDYSYLAGPKQRLLILNFTVQNPLNREQSVSSSSFQFTAVSPDDENFEFRDYMLQTTKLTRISQSLKPAQKVKATVVFAIYDSGPISKVMVQRGSGAVLRYDLTGKIPPIESPFAVNQIDLQTLSNKKYVIGEPEFAMGPFGVKIEKIEFNRDVIRNYPPNKDFHYFVVHVSFRNMMLRPESVGFQYFTPQVKYPSGEECSWNRSLNNLTGDSELGQSVDPDSTITGKYCFHYPDIQGAPTSLRLTCIATGRTMDVSIPPLSGRDGATNLLDLIRN